MRRALGIALALLVVSVTGCTDDGERPEVDAAPPTEAALPAYCSTRGDEDADFWRLVEESCRVATDGDAQQGRALRNALEGLSAPDVAQFHRTFVEVSGELHTQRLADLADELCAPGLGLGADLFTDFRSWIIAHGQVVVERVLEEPQVLADFPDIAGGCGMGEPFGYAATAVYLEKTGRSARDSGLPPIEPTGPPTS